MHSDSIDPITGHMDKVRRALTTDTSTVGRYGVSVEVRADGSLESVRIDESITPYGTELGALITTLAGEALAQARENAHEAIDELSADPRIAAVVDSLETASQQPPPREPVRSANTEPADPDDELTEEELIELNERRNRSFFQSW
ncbi:YbaB/EbfC family nucleoid-associated protein [Nocardia cyriacigeorgica]|uniref:YbaB/EbfC family nucleoid-associated protein n=1 Tax=Nocardia cyriacigeorgica TaxID=135487 RepID=A0A5R8NS15_9NOCA|nr:YbaB/EbfC family nucleoid-associated protein [Nocardia cyriacigeorgica]TLF78358.1 hypothetical protein FEK34_10895 [Nocardia cyriacigeorgica]